MHRPNRNKKNVDPSAFTLISQIFASDMSFRLKMDCVSRILALRYNFEVVSTLLYDGQSDSLINRGSFIDYECVRYMGKDEEAGRKSRHMLKHIAFYDYLYSKFYHKGIPDQLTRTDIARFIAEFTNDICFSYNFDEELLTPEFVLECHRNSIYLATDGKTKKGSYYLLDNDSFYNRYKRRFKSMEQYDIGPYVNNYSGRVYWESSVKQSYSAGDYDPLFFQQQFLNNDEAKTPFVMDKRNLYLFFHLQRYCGYKIRGTYRYCGIPLWWNGRCLGVLRILTRLDNTETYDDPDRVKSLRHASEIISKSLDQNYAREFVDRIDHNWNENHIYDISNEKAKTDAFCSSMRFAMDSFGCLLHVSTYMGDMPAIIGNSTDSRYFAPLTDLLLQQQKLDGFIAGRKFNPLLSKLFYSSMEGMNLLVEENYRLVGLSFNVNQNVKNHTGIKYFYCHKDTAQLKESELVRETTDPYIFKTKTHPDLRSLFHPVVLAAFKNIPATNRNKEAMTIKVEYILVMDIPASSVEGFISFYNTSNRCFNLSDAQFAYGEMKRFGMGLSRVNKERSKNYREINESYFHDIKNLLSVCIAQHIIDTPGNTGSGSPFATLDLLHYIYSKVVSFQRLADHTSKYGIRRYQETSWNIPSIIEKHCNRLSLIGSFYKDTRIWLDMQKITTPDTELNQEIFELCFFLLLENALKYSYGKESKCRVPGFVESDEKTPGHIHVTFSEDDTDYIISIKNWGCPIPDPDNIFEKCKTPESVQEFLTEENPVIEYHGRKIGFWRASRRVGLYALRKFLQPLKGECHPFPNYDQTIFTLKIKKDDRSSNKRQGADPLH